MEYKKTLNLPKTDFPIKSNPKVLEPALLEFWDKEDIYHKALEKRANSPKYILHDGPPYPNGDIHLGHALNKILKDIIVKYKLMTGFGSPFVPGWDCHGLPIETQLIKELGGTRPADKVEFRNKCKEYALRYVDIQRNEFKRLGIMGEWNAPYLTLNPSYEEAIVEIFGVLAEKGFVYRGKKPIHWCPTCRTALAEAEIEYEDDRSPSIYVRFKLKRFESKSPKFKHLEEVLKNNAYIVIWTTTPWTIPSNAAIALHPEFDYVAVKTGDNIYIVAEGLLGDFVKRLKIEEFKVLEKFKGSVMEGALAEHPFAGRDSIVVLDELVTLEQGTGAVHIAPGHGAEDYKVGKKYDLPMIMPVDEKGVFTSEAGKYAGMKYDEANKAIGEDMKASGALIHLEFIKHSYPHCWRCKKPVIFRATEQWFIAVDHDGLREKALKSIGDTKWFPSWGENRIRGMVEVRPDWCISRQRSWGVPIPIFYCRDCGKPHMTGKFNRAIRELFKKEGSSAWFSRSAEEILPIGLSCDCGGTKFEKEQDILDVWFESGVSHWAVLHGSKDLRWPADLYLEGSDQHRGWFQSSLLLAVGAKGRAPYDAVLTHGFTVDEFGKKMSKSLGNVVDPQKVVEKYGADVLRLWVASADFREDVSASDNKVKQVAEAYGKIRNTCRFLISNLNGFDPKSDLVPYEKLKEVDKWALIRLSRLIERVARAYGEFEFHVVFHAIRDYCVNDLSSQYLDMSKDILYCSSKDSHERRSTQTVLFEILRSMTLLFAPVLSFTAEDVWKTVPGVSGSVFLSDMPGKIEKYIDEGLEKKWDKILAVREEAYKAMEEIRAKGEIAGSLEASVEVWADEKTLSVLKSVDDLSMIFICSEVKLIESKSEGLKVKARKADFAKCERCWNLKETVGKDELHKTLCLRCAGVVRSIQ